jgi:hypothetical protein
MKLALFWLGSCILASLIALTFRNQPSFALSSQQTKPAGFEYKLVPVALGTDLRSGEALISEYDSAGWELIAVHSLTSTNGDKNLHFRDGSSFTGKSQSFRATDQYTEAKKAFNKSDALYIFKRAKPSK